MWPGKLQTIRFEFTGPSVQAVLDKIPTARIIERESTSEGKPRYLIEAETYGNGIKMWLLSQGAWVKVVAPADFVEEIKKEIARLINDGINSRLFSAIKKAAYGEAVKRFDSNDNIVTDMIDVAISGGTLFDSLDILKEINGADIIRCLKKFTDEASVLSVIIPKK